MKSKTKVSLYAALFLVLSPVYAGEAADAERLLGTWMDWTERRQQIGTNYYAYSREESDKIWARLREEESKIFTAIEREYAALGDVGFAWRPSFLHEPLPLWIQNSSVLRPAPFSI